ncbi:MAG: hypothetical protein ABEK84_03350 [Salinibacter sp.]
MQLPGVAGQFPNYASYASATFEDVLPPKRRKDARTLCSERFVSSYLENLGDGEFRVRPLPVEAQFAPVFGMNTGDYNGDGLLDVLLVGNSFAPPPSTGRYDALIGALLRGDGEGGFEAVDVRRSGFSVEGDAKGLVEIALSDGRRLLVVSRNDGRLKAFATSPTGQRWFAAKPDDAYALIPRPGGHVEKREFRYGHTYLSHSSRGVYVGAATDTITVVDYQGHRRTVSLQEATAENAVDARTTGAAPPQKSSSRP